MRRPAPPPAVEEWARRFGGTSLEARGEPLVEAAAAALGHALAHPGRSREAAYALLAADALLTGACEDAAEAADPEAELRELLARLREIDTP